MVPTANAVGVSLSEIDPELRPASSMRVRPDSDAVAEYAELLDILPPVRLAYDPESGLHLVIDGAQRITAARHAGRDEIAAIVEDADRIEAWRLAARANKKHGVRPNPADKRHRVEEFLKLPEAKGLTQQQIADICDVTRQYVSQIAGRINAHECNSCESERLSDGLTEAQQRVADTLAADPSLTVKEAAKQAGVSEGTVVNARKKLGLSESAARPEPPDDPQDDDRAAATTHDDEVPSIEEQFAAALRDTMARDQLESGGRRGRRERPRREAGDHEPDFESTWRATEEFLVAQFESMPESFRPKWTSLLESLVGQFYDGSGWNNMHTEEVCLGDD